MDSSERKQADIKGLEPSTVLSALAQLNITFYLGLSVTTYWFSPLFVFT